jgi:hypothetical protein
MKQEKKTDEPMQEFSWYDWTTGRSDQIW